MKQVLVAAAIIAGIIAAGDHANAAVDKWQPCKYEDGSGQVRCVWDASVRGVGGGQSFFMNARGQHFVTHERAHHMLQH